ncbi:unnamed protein product [Arctogadus glacialis]
MFSASGSERRKRRGNPEEYISGSEELQGVTRCLGQRVPYHGLPGEPSSRLGWEIHSGVGDPLLRGDLLQLNRRHSG